ncbi:MAG: endonuclease MutS2, partial [Chthonomonadales bacterium]
MSLTPTAFPEIVRTRLQETAESRALRDFDSGIPLGGIRDIREHVQRAAMGGVLVPLELLDVSSTVAASRRIKQYLFKRKDTAPLLGEIGHNIPQFPLLGQISEAIAENGILRDNATPELARLRSATKTTAQRLNEKLQSVLTSDKFKTYIQEPIITVRDGRYCIPVKAENRGLFGGMVHDLSQSGATAFVEPAATVELGNDLKELTIKEEQEVYRILTRLSGLVSAVASELGDAIRLLGNLDLMNAKALVAEEMIAVQPIMNHKGIIRIRRARHPLLTPPVVPIEVHLGDRFTTLLITGPNTGGKTVALKTVGLLTLMAQSGLEIPAEPGSELSIFEQVFADIGDEQD